MELQKHERVRPSMIFRCFGCCFSREDVANDHVLQPLNMFNLSTQEDSFSQMLFQSRKARLETYRRCGLLQEVTIDEYYDSDNGMPVPKWPSERQSFRIVHRPKSKTVMIVSDGLSDPFSDLQQDTNVNGYGLEFYVETPVDEIGLGLQEIKSSWQYQLLFTVCSMAAGHGGIRHIIDYMDILSTEAEGISESIPSEYRHSHVNSEQRVGALLGLVESSSDGQNRTFLDRCSILPAP